MSSRYHRRPRASWALPFCIGALVGGLASVLTQGATLFTILPMLWSWGVVVAVVGSRTADAHHWASYLLTACLHGAWLVALRAGVILLVRRRDERRPPPRWTLAAAVALHVILLLIPAGPD